MFAGARVCVETDTGAGTIAQRGHKFSSEPEICVATSRNPILFCNYSGRHVCHRYMVKGVWGPQTMSITLQPETVILCTYFGVLSSEFNEQKRSIAVRVVLLSGQVCGHNLVGV